MELGHIDHGKKFDWGKTSEDYAKYRDIYPDEFYKKIIKYGLCVKGQHVLDVGTGTGVLPRNLYKYGASFTGADISEEQISYAKKLTEQKHMQIEYIVNPVEEIDYPDNTFDVITACQCFHYFDQKVVFPNLYRMLKPQGKIVILFMEWLPYEDPIAGASEKLVLQHNPDWTGFGYKREPAVMPEAAKALFTLDKSILYDLEVPFTKTSWNGRMKSCRGIGASLDPSKIEIFEQQHMELLDKIAPENFKILHSVTMLIIKSKKTSE